MNYQVKSFAELTTKEFFNIARERIAVFVVEQQCPYQEIDEIDEVALHTWLEEDGAIIGYTRIYTEGTTVSFGRVLIKKSQRRRQLGKKLVAATLAEIEKRYPKQPIVIGGQAYLKEFYESFGFVITSALYLEDGIPHYEMTKK
ncbi:GNAT family N-acetyltransferase [Enterococcus faecalis]